MDRIYTTMVLLVAAMTALMAVKSVDAVHCYSCNSGEKYNGTDCRDLPNDAAKKKFTVNCTELALEEQKALIEQGSKDAQLREYKLCRIFYQDVEGDSRVVRSCATSGQPERGCIDRTGTSKIKLRYCECTDDLCNESNALTAAILVTSLAAISAYVLGRH